MTSVVILDVTDLLCPLPVLKARKKLMTMSPGALLKVRATDPMARIDMPHFCAEAGHDFLGMTEGGMTETDGSVTEYLIRRGPDRIPGPEEPEF